jgi:hypothetical protein
MAFKRDNVKKGLSLPGLIDIIFLLLIFSLVTLSITHATVEPETQGKRKIDIDLPETKSRLTEEIDEVLQTLLFEINYLEPDNPATPKMLYVLRPSLRDSITILEARERAIKDSLYAAFPQSILNLSDRQFANLKACRLIRTSIRNFKNSTFFEPNPANTIKIRAIKDMEFRIFNYILDQCSTYGDTIPRIVTHTLSEFEGSHGL